MNDKIEYQILEDGTVRWKTEKISDANHNSADELLDELAEALGGERVTEKRKHTHGHHHHGVGHHHHH